MALAKRSWVFLQSLEFFNQRNFLVYTEKCISSNIWRIHLIWFFLFNLAKAEVIFLLQFHGNFQFARNARHYCIYYGVVVCSYVIFVKPKNARISHRQIFCTILEKLGNNGILSV